MEIKSAAIHMYGAALRLSLLFCLLLCMAVSRNMGPQGGNQTLYPGRHVDMPSVDVFIQVPTPETLITCHKNGPLCE
jgi:hypothetical protein